MRSHAFHIDTFNRKVFIITWALTPPQTQTLNKMSCNCIHACFLIKLVLWNSTSVEWAGGVWRLLEWFIGDRGKPCSGICCPVIQHISFVCIKSNLFPSVSVCISCWIKSKVNICILKHLVLFPSFLQSFAATHRQDVLCFLFLTPFPVCLVCWAPEWVISFKKKSWPCPQTATQIAHVHHTCHSNARLVESVFHHLFGPFHIAHLSCCPCHWLMGTVKKSPRSHVAAVVTSGKQRRGGRGGGWRRREEKTDRNKEGGRGGKTKLWWCDRFFFFKKEEKKKGRRRMLCV